VGRGWKTGWKNLHVIYFVILLVDGTDQKKQCGNHIITSYTLNRLEMRLENENEGIKKGLKKVP
jgi:hypothetical protein